MSEGPDPAVPAPDRRGGADPIPDDVRRANLAHRNEWTRIHGSPGFCDVAGFKAGTTSLWPLELEELGPYVAEGTTLLHLQCHSGLDTLSWARRGAVVTGVDFSAKAVGLARLLAEEVGLSGRARFVQANVYELPAALDGQFDVVFSSRGVLMWLDDLERWAEVVAGLVRPGGIFYLAEFHPVACLIDDGEHIDELRVTSPYFQGHEPVRFDEPRSYADPAALTPPTVTYEWHHGFAEVVTLLLRQGLRLDFLHEFPVARGLCLPFLERGADGWHRVRGGRDDLPLSYSLKMTKEAP